MITNKQTDGLTELFLKSLSRLKILRKLCQLLGVDRCVDTSYSFVWSLYAGIFKISFNLTVCLVWTNHFTKTRGSNDDNDQIKSQNYSRSSEEEDLPCWVLGLLLSGGWVVTCPHPRLHDGVPCSHVYTRVTSMMIQFPFPIIIISRVFNSSLLWRSIFVTLIYHSRHMNITTGTCDTRVSYVNNQH